MVPVIAQAVTTAGIAAVLAFGPWSLSGTGRPAGDGARWLDAPNLLLLVLLLANVVFVTMALRRWRRLKAYARRLPAQLDALAREGALPPHLSTKPPADLRPVIRQLHEFAALAHQDRAAKADLEKKALTDPLTGLPNRRGLLEFVNKVIGGRRGWTNPSTVGVMHVDLDHFKTINDTLGHDAGDHVLREATKRMQATVRESDLIARLGGDEFALVLPGIENEQILKRLATRLIEKFEPPIAYGDELCRVGVSVGVVLGHRQGEPISPTLLLTHADIALTQAKASGRGRVAVFDPSMATAVAETSGRVAEIRQGLLNDAFLPWFQPIIGAREGNLIGMSIKPRWQHPERGLLGLSEFQKTAESHNVIEEIGMQVFEKACAAVLDWRRDGIDPGVISFNLSRAQLLAPGVVDKLTWIIDDAGIPPEQFAVQAAEQDCQGRSVEIVFSNLQRLREHGVGIELDDFGVSSASLANLSTLQCSRICCNASTVEGFRLAADSGPDLLRGLLAALHAMELEILVKNVDTPGELERLRAHGFHAFQGIAIAPAMSGDEATAWLRAQHDQAARKAAG